MAERSEVNFLPRVISTFLGVTRILRVISELLPTHHLQPPLPFTLFFSFSKHATQIVSTKVNKLQHQLRLLMTYRSTPKVLHSRNSYTSILQRFSFTVYKNIFNHGFISPGRYLKFFLSFFYHYSYQKSM